MTCTVSKQQIIDRIAEHIKYNEGELGKAVEDFLGAKIVDQSVTGDKIKLESLQVGGNDIVNIPNYCVVPVVDNGLEEPTESDIDNADFFVVREYYGKDKYENIARFHSATLDYEDAKAFAELKAKKVGQHAPVRAVNGIIYMVKHTNIYQNPSSSSDIGVASSLVEALDLARNNECAVSDVKDKNGHVVIYGQYLNSPGTKEKVFSTEFEDDKTRLLGKEN